MIYWNAKSSIPISSQTKHQTVDLLGAQYLNITSSNFHDLKHISAYNSVQLTLYPGAAPWERLSLHFLLY